MRERIHTALCMVLVLTIFTGCKGMGALFKVAAVVAYVGVRAAVAAAASSHGSSSESVRQDPDTCACVPVNHGSTWCERQEGEDRCVLKCDANWNFRAGICVPSEQLVSQAP